MIIHRALVAAFFLPAIISAQSSPAPKNDIITAAKMRADLEFLSGDGFRGRLTDTPENALALEWVKGRFQWLGLKPMGAMGTYFLPYDLSIGALAAGNELTVTIGSTASRYNLSTGFYPHRYSASTTATGDVAFALRDSRTGAGLRRSRRRSERKDPARPRPRAR